MARRSAQSALEDEIQALDASLPLRCQQPLATFEGVRERRDSVVEPLLVVLQGFGVAFVAGSGDDDEFDGGHREEQPLQIRRALRACDGGGEAFFEVTVGQQRDDGRRFEHGDAVDGQCWHLAEGMHIAEPGLAFVLARSHVDDHGFVRHPQLLEQPAWAGGARERGEVEGDGRGVDLPRQRPQGAP